METRVYRPFRNPERDRLLARIGAHVARLTPDHAATFLADACTPQERAFLLREYPQLATPEGEA